MRYEAVYSVVISNLILKSVSLEFNVSSKILLKEPLFTSDPRVTELIQESSTMLAQCWLRIIMLANDSVAK